MNDGITYEKGRVTNYKHGEEVWQIIKKPLTSAINAAFTHHQKHLHRMKQLLDIDN